MPRTTGGEVEHIVADLAVLTGDIRAVARRRQPEQLGDRRGDVDEPTRPRHHAVGPHALPRDDERRPGLHDVEGAVLTAVAALVLPVVRGRVDHAEVGRRRVVEQLRDLVERERVRVLLARRVWLGALGGKPRELVGGLVGERIGARGGDRFVPAVVRAPEPDPAVVRASLVTAAACHQHHVDDRIERRVEQHLERALGVGLVLGRDLVSGDGHRRGGHDFEANACT